MMPKAIHWDSLELGRAVRRQVGSFMSFTVGVSMGTTSSAASGAALALLALMVATNDLKGQGPVSGQVSIIERPGESTEDLGNTVIYLEAPPAMRPKLQPSTETIALQSRQFS